MIKSVMLLFLAVVPVDGGTVAKTARAVGKTTKAAESATAGAKMKIPSSKAAKAGDKSTVGGAGLNATGTNIKTTLGGARGAVKSPVPLGAVVRSGGERAKHSSASPQKTYGFKIVHHNFEAGKLDTNSIIVSLYFENLC